MNVGIMSFVNSSTTTSNVTTTNKLTDNNLSTKFGDVFSKVISTENNSTLNQSTEDLDVDGLQKLLQSDSLEEIFDLLNIPYDGLFVTMEDNIKSFDELMNLDDLLSILGIDLTELQNVLNSLIGQEVKNSSDIWQIIEQVNENAPQIIAQLQSALAGNQSITPKQAQQFLTFLKLAQITGNQSDLVLDQPLLLTQTKEVVETVIKEFMITKSTESNSGKVTVQNFQQVIERVLKTETTETPTENVSKESSQISGQTQQAITTKTVTIQLPTEKTGQAEELVNRIEKLLNQSQISKNQGIIRLQLKLYPENLGSIRIELLQKDGVLSARILATTAAGKELLDSQLHQLKNAFVQQNIQLDRLDVQQAIQEKDLRDQNLFNNFFNQQQQSNEDDDDQEQTDEQDEEKPSFRDYLLNVEV